MKKIIHHLRRQPEHVRKHIVHVSIIIVAIILLLLWVYSLGTRLTNPDTQAKMKEDLKPLSTFKDNIVGGYQSIILNGNASTH
ncbi:MAG TPA: hypothetical protein VGO21_04620 [Candidatus Paceibacterota bacterium]|jgi:hypothetical protein|nr:hypothetical protein [Candidatus Paceibacterota bacterium]